MSFLSMPFLSSFSHSRAPAGARRARERLYLPAPLLVAALFWLSAPLPACAINGKPAVDRDTIVMAISKEIFNLDPDVTASGDSQRYGWQIFDTLYTVNRQGQLVPSLATGYTASPDGKTYTFKLRSGVNFHNGAEMTADDVVFSLQRILDPATKSTRRPSFAGVVDKVEATDPQTVVFSLKQPDGAFLNKIAGYLFIEPKAYALSLPSVEAFAHAPIGAGPYRFVEQKIGQSLTLARFDDFWGEKPGVKNLIFRLIEEPASRVNALLTGEVDMSDGVPSVEIARLRGLKGLVVDTVPIGSPLAVRIYANQPGTPLANPKVRLALNYAIDHDALIKNVMHGVGAPLATYISSYYGYGVNHDVKPYAYDPKLAKSLLREAGYPNGFDTSLYDPSDMPTEIAETVSAYWSQIGVRAKVQRIDYAAWSRLNNTHKSGPLTLMQMSNAIFDPSRPVQGAASKEGTWSDYSNPEVEALLAQSAGVADRAGRDAIFQKIGAILHDDAQAVLLSELFYTFARDKDIDWSPQPGIAWLNLRDLRWKPATHG